MKIFKDGNMWCVVKDDFENLQESDALFISDKEYKEFIKSIKNEDKLGIHGQDCPHCLGGPCECHCEMCRPDLWINGKPKET